MAQNTYAAEATLKAIVESELVNEIPPGQLEEFMEFADSRFGDKTLWKEQQEALSNIMTFMAWWFRDYQRNMTDKMWAELRDRIDFATPGPDGEHGVMETLFLKYEEHTQGHFHESAVVENKGDNAKNGKFEQMAHYYESGVEEKDTLIENNGVSFIRGNRRVNRISTWMATASGKSLVMIKLVEALGALMSCGSIPTGPIMLLAPVDYITEQIKAAIDEYNRAADPGVIPIRAIDLLEARDDLSQGRVLLPTEREIPVYFYKAGNITKKDDKSTAQTTSVNDIENGGKWYVLFDEAHHGDDDKSLAKCYVDILSRNALLFFFSATLSDPLDRMTTIYDFGLPAFTSAGYGKNPLLMNEEYSIFSKNRSGAVIETEEGKELIVVQSLILQAALTRYHELMDGRADGTCYYHTPLHLVVCNTVTESGKKGKKERADNEADLQRFFRILGLFATGNTERDVFNDAKRKLVEFLGRRRRFDFNKGEHLDAGISGGRQCSFLDIIEEMDEDDVKECIFGSREDARLEFVATGAPDEMAFQLSTASQPCGLIRIGEVGKFVREILDKDGDGYTVNDETIYDEPFFDEIDRRDHIRLLLGSRKFYEGWDTNRPSVESIIGIGTQDSARKFVPQVIGRGVRLCADPDEPGNRKRPSTGTAWKNVPMETLFVFATKNQTIRDVISTTKGTAVETQRHRSGILEKNDALPCPLIRPNWRECPGMPLEEKLERGLVPTIELAPDCRKRFASYIDAFDPRALYLRRNLKVTNKEILFIKQHIGDDQVFKNNEDKNYADMDFVLKMVLDTLRETAWETDPRKPLHVVDDEDIKSYSEVSFQFTDRESSCNDEREVLPGSQLVAFNESSGRTTVFEKLGVVAKAVSNGILVSEQEEVDDEALVRSDAAAEVKKQQFQSGHPSGVPVITFDFNAQTGTVIDFEAVGSRHFYYNPILTYRDDYKSLARSDVRNEPHFQLLMNGTVREPSEAAFFHQLLKLMDPALRGPAAAADPKIAGTSALLDQLPWAMAPLDETKDKGVFIPYFDSIKTSWHKWYPDFIFTVENEDDDGNTIYDTFFVDPKGMHKGGSQAEDKMNGYYRLLCDDNGNPTVFEGKVEIDGEEQIVKCRFHALLINDQSTQSKSMWLTAQAAFNEQLFEELFVSNNDSMIERNEFFSVDVADPRSTSYDEYYAPASTLPSKQKKRGRSIKK